MDMGEVWGNVLAGCVVALVVALIAWLGTDRFAQRQESTRARRERDLAGAEELYGVYGQFFATWKAWEFVRGRNSDKKGTVPDERRQELLGKAAEVEGRYESLIVRVALEHGLKPDERAALWSLRFALKELRSAIRKDAPLGWWRTDDSESPVLYDGAKEYSAFKVLTSRVASIFVYADTHLVAPSRADRNNALAAITATNLPADEPRSGGLKGSDWQQVLVDYPEREAT